MCVLSTEEQRIYLVSHETGYSMILMKCCKFGLKVIYRHTDANWERFCLSLKRPTLALCVSLFLLSHFQTKAGITRSSFFAQFSCITVFWAITSRRNFLAWLLARRNHLGISANKLPKISHVIFLRQKHLHSIQGISLEFATAIVISCALLIHCYFSFAKMIQARLQKRKAAAIL